MISKGLKIAIFHNLPSGGAKRLLFEHVLRLSLQGHRFEEFTFSSADLNFMDLRPHTDAQHVYNVSRLCWYNRHVPLLTPYIHALQGVSYQLQLDHLAATIAHQIDSRGFDLVYAHDCLITTIPFLLRHLSTPSVFYLHSLPYFRYSQPNHSAISGPLRILKTFFYAPAFESHVVRARWIDKANLKSARAVHINSFFAADWITQHYGVRPCVTYPGVDSSVFHPMGLPRDDFVLAVGSVTEGKGYRFMISALGKLPLSKRPKLVIAANFGDPAEIHLVTNLASNLNVDIDIRNVRNTNDMVRLYNQAKVVLFTPIQEPLGLVALEAMACGTPVIAVNEAGPSETVKHGLTGLLVERSVDEFSLAVQSLLFDPSRIDKMGKAGVNYTRHRWTWDRAVDEMTLSFEKVLS